LNIKLTNNRLIEWKLITQRKCSVSLCFFVLMMNFNWICRDPQLVKKIGEATALESRATGIPYVFAPCIAVIGIIKIIPYLFVIQHSGSFKFCYAIAPLVDNTCVSRNNRDLFKFYYVVCYRHYWKHYFILCVCVGV
jgi:hypothetical protein